jgi:hypothetical protein
MAIPTPKFIERTGEAFYESDEAMSTQGEFTERREGARFAVVIIASTLALSSADLSKATVAAEAPIVQSGESSTPSDQIFFLQNEQSSPSVDVEFELAKKEVDSDMEQLETLSYSLAENTGSTLRALQKIREHHKQYRDEMDGLLAELKEYCE